MRMPTFARFEPIQRDRALPIDYDPYADANATRLHLFSYMKMNDWAMWREFQHDEFYTPLQRAYATSRSTNATLTTLPRKPRNSLRRITQISELLYQSGVIGSSRPCRKFDC